MEEQESQQRDTQEEPVAGRRLIVETTRKTQWVVR